MNALRALAERIAGLEDRRTATLTALIEQARAALAGPIQQDAQQVIVEAMTSRYEELTGESISHDNEGARQILRALGDAGLKIVPADQPEQPDDLPEIWWKPEDDRGPSCLSVRMIGGQKAYRRHWDFGTSREFIEWGWVVADTAVRLTPAGAPVTADGYDMVERFWEAAWPTLAPCDDECGACKPCITKWAVGWTLAALSNPDLVAKAEQDGAWKAPTEPHNVDNQGRSEQ